MANVMPRPMPGSEPEKRTQAEAVANSEDDRVGYSPRQQTQRAMLAAQQVIGEIQAAEHIEATACKTDGRKGVVVHPVIVAASLWPLHSGVRCRCVAWAHIFTSGVPYAHLHHSPDGVVPPLGVMLSIIF